MEFFSNLLSPIENLLQFVLGGLYNVNSMFGLNITAALRFEEEEVMDDGNSVPVDTDAN